MSDHLSATSINPGQSSRCAIRPSQQESSTCTCNYCIKSIKVQNLGQGKDLHCFALVLPPEFLESLDAHRRMVSGSSRHRKNKGHRNAETRVAPRTCCHPGFLPGASGASTHLAGIRNKLVHRAMLSLHGLLGRLTKGSLRRNELHGWPLTEWVNCKSGQVMLVQKTRARRKT